MRRFVTLYMKRFVSQLSHPTEAVEVQAVDMELQLLQLVEECQNKSAKMFPGNSVEMFLDRFQDKSVRVFQDRCARMYQKKYAILFPNRNVLMYQHKSVIMFQSKFLGRNVRMFL